MKVKNRHLFFTLAVVAGVFLAVFDHGRTRWERHAPEGAFVRPLKIESGSTVKRVGRQLVEGGWAKGELDWRLYCALNPCDGIKAGSYEFADREGLKTVVESLRKGKVATRKVTIPEGRASWEIFSILKRHYPELDSLRWEKLVHDPAFAATLGVQANSLEGWLLPDTYPLPAVADEAQLLKYLVQSFENVWKSLPVEDSPVHRRYGKLGVLTLASIVEEEAATPGERGHIAGVFWNRLQRNISLGADPTVRFIFRSLSGPIYQSQLDSDSPYNTRKFRGLPPGPISNPGRDALLAALNPDRTDDIFFVAKDDGSREHFFAPTLAKHNEYRQVAARNRAKAGRTD